MTTSRLDPDPHPARWWHPLPDGKLQCDLCPRDCRLQEGQRGACFVRQRQGDGMHLTTWGRASGFCLDPIEKKPLNHFLPGSSVLSFGTAGCNLACKFCQNWEISRAHATDRLNAAARPEEIAQTALHHGAASVAYTYNDPVIFAEYALDTAAACRERGIRNVAVTAGYIHRQPALEFFRAMDAANVDLKAFTDDFYHRLCAGHLDPVLDTLRLIRHETDCWLEITTLLIPGANDSEAEIAALSEWIARELGPDVPLHFTAYHPDYRYLDAPATPATTLQRARTQAHAAGLHHVYTGNVSDLAGGTTHCPHCQRTLIVRDRYELRQWHLDGEGKCTACGHTLAGHYHPAPGNFGNRRIPVQIGAAHT